MPTEPIIMLDKLEICNQKDPPVQPTQQEYYLFKLG